MRLYIVLAIDNDRRLHFWTGKTWMEYMPVDRIPMWKEQGAREADIARRFLPAGIPAQAVFYAQVFRPEPTQPAPKRI